jgi:hypothetical protein
MNLENRIVSLTLSDRLSHNDFSDFSGELIENKPPLVDSQNDSLRNGGVKALLRKGFKMPGFITSSPRKGTETSSRAAVTIRSAGFITSSPRKGTETCP